jgi:hypothetical protein
MVLLVAPPRALALLARLHDGTVVRPGPLASMEVLAARVG